MKSQRHVGMAVFGTLALVWVGCASLSLRGSDFGTAAAEHSATRFAWHDLVALEVDSSQHFYHSLFGWTFVSSGLKGYDWIVHTDRVIGGLIDARELPRAPQSAVWLVGVVVPDVATVTAHVRDAGGVVLREPQTLPRRGDMALIADPGGALLQLIANNSYAHGFANPRIGEWLWAELITDDIARSAVFYGETLSFNAVTVREQYSFLVENNIPQAGMVSNQFEDTASTWIPFVRVADPSVVAARAVELGGQLVIPPGEALRGGSVALILDPGGAPLALQRWDGPAREEEEQP